MQFVFNPILQRCCECGKRSYCPANSLIKTRIAVSKRDILQNVSFPTDSYICHQGAPRKNLFFVKSGSIKNVYTNELGDQQIIDFRYAGEFIELMSLEHSTHSSTAVTLEKSLICVFSMRFIMANRRINGFLENIQKRSETEIRHHHEALLSNNRHSANKRLGIFLLDIIERQSLNYDNSAMFQLAMSRTDMANYLGLAPETVSRTFSHYVKQGLITVRKKNIAIKDINKLIEFIV